MTAVARYIRIRWVGAALVLVCLASTLIKIPHLGHQHLTHDEACHAIVARNLLKHPFTPTLYDTPYLPYDYKSWTSNRVWLHKPILPLWKIAASYALFGVNTFALRLPSLILAALAVFLTYLIGRELFNKRAAFAAAAIQAFLPVMAELTHGYLFSDAIDISLLFWTEFAIYFLIRTVKTGLWRYALLAGFGQGCAYLSKSYLALIVTGVALAAWLAPAFRLGQREDVALRGRHILGLIGVSLAVAFPWTISTVIRFPQEFHYEHAYVLRHLVDDIESWRAPWDRLLFDYLPFMLHIFFVAAAVAVFALLKPLFTKKRVSLCVAYAWAFGVIIPHLFAMTKTPSATLIAVPALLLILAELIAQAVSKRSNIRSLCVLTGIALVVLVLPQAHKGWGKGFPDNYVFGSLFLERPWPAVNVAAALTIAGGIYWLRRRFITADRTTYFRWLCFGFVLASSLTLAWRAVFITSNVAGGRATPTPYAQVADYVRNELPLNAVLFVEIEENMSPLEHLKAMFLTDRTAYRYRELRASRDQQLVREKGGKPYLLSMKLDYDLKLFYRSIDNGAAVYALPSEDAQTE